MWDGFWKVYFQKYGHQGLDRTGLRQPQGPEWQELMISLPRILGAGVTFLGENMSLAQLGSHGHLLGASGTSGLTVLPDLMQRGERAPKERGFWSQRLVCTGLSKWGCSCLGCPK